MAQDGALLGGVTAPCTSHGNSMLWVHSVVSAELEAITHSHMWPLITWLTQAHLVDPPITCKQRGDGEAMTADILEAGEPGNGHCQGNSDWYPNSHGRWG